MSGFVLSFAAVIHLATSCQQTVAPITIAKIAQHESGLNSRAVNRNKDGSLDVGLMQINERNWSWLGIRNMREAMDPCRSIRAAGDLMASLSRYNTGSPTRGLGYAEAVQDQKVGVVQADFTEAAPATVGGARQDTTVITAPDVYTKRSGAARELVFSTR